MRTSKQVGGLALSKQIDRHSQYDVNNSSNANNLRRTSSIYEIVCQRVRKSVALPSDVNDLFAGTGIVVEVGWTTTHNNLTI